MKLQILIPRYNEPFEVMKPMLDSLAVQQNVDFDELGVIITNDGDKDVLDEKVFEPYPFKIEYYVNEHKGVSATRNACLDKAKADYVMFCDCDDMFYSVTGLWTIFNEIENGGFETFISVFVEEGRHPDSKEVYYLFRGDPNNGGIDSTFVHGKVHNRKFLLRNKIRWNDSLTIHEDSFFNCLCQRLADPNKAKFCPMPFYLWKWNDNSVCRHDPKYILKTYNNMLDSNTALVSEFQKRGRLQDAQFYSVSMIFDAYYTMNKDEWINQENKEYRDNTEKRFKNYYLQFKVFFDTCPEQTKNLIIQGIRTRMFGEGLGLEKITFDQWIKHIESL